MISAVSTSSLPAINGNSLFWVMAALILGLSVAVIKLAGAVHRGKQVQVPIPGGEPGFARPVARPQDDVPGPPVRRLRVGRVLTGAALLAGVLFVADKLQITKTPSAVPGTAASPSPRPSPKVTAAPVPRPSASPSASGPPVTATHAASHFPLSGIEIVIIAVVLICGLVAYGINRDHAREM